MDFLVSSCEQHPMLIGMALYWEVVQWPLALIQLQITDYLDIGLNILVMLSQNEVFSEFYWIISVILTNLKELFWNIKRYGNSPK